MPLDVQPLSPTRRIIALAVLLAFLGGSLLLAQSIVARHKNSPQRAVSDSDDLYPQMPPLEIYRDGIQITLPDRPGYQAMHTDEGNNVDVWAAAYPSGKVVIKRTDGWLRTTPAHPLRNREISGATQSQVNQQYGTAIGSDSVIVPIGNIPGQGIIGIYLPSKAPAVYAVGTGIRQHYLMLAVSGDDKKTPRALTAEDIDEFNSFCRSAVITFGNKPAAVTASAPATTQAAQTRKDDEHEKK